MARLGLREWISFFAPTANSAVHREHVGVSHFLQVVGGQSGTKSASTIEHDGGIEFGHSLLNVALDDSLSQVNRSRQVIFCVLTFLADIYQHKFLTRIQSALDFVHICFANALLCIIYHA